MKTFQQGKSESLNPLQIRQIVEHELDYIVDDISKPSFIEASKDFIPVKVDTDKFPNDARKYRVQGLPTILFLDHKGNVLEKIVGYRKIDTFLETMDKITKS